MPRGSRPRFRLSGAAPAPDPRVPRGSSDSATQRGLPPRRNGHAHLRWACPEAVGRASVCPEPLRLRILASREDPPTPRLSAASRRDGTGTPTCGGHAPRQSAALPFVRSRSGSGSSRPARILRLRDSARPPAAMERARPPAVGMPRGSRPRFRLSGAAPAPRSSDCATRGPSPGAADPIASFGLTAAQYPNGYGVSRLRSDKPSASGRFVNGARDLPDLLVRVDAPSGHHLDRAEHVARAGTR